MVSGFIVFLGLFSDRKRNCTNRKQKRARLGGGRSFYCLRSRRTRSGMSTGDLTRHHRLRTLYSNCLLSTASSPIFSVFANTPSSTNSRAERLANLYSLFAVAQRTCLVPLPFLDSFYLYSTFSINALAYRFHHRFGEQYLLLSYSRCLFEFLLDINLSSLSNYLHAARMICCVVRLPPSPLHPIDRTTFIVHLRCFR